MGTAKDNTASESIFNGVSVSRGMTAMRMMWKSLITIKEVNHDPNRKSYSSRRDSRGRVLETDEHQFGTGPEFWINLQANYDLCVAAAQSEKEIAAIPQLAFS